MQDEITFIDDFINKKIKDFKIKPSREWREMQTYIKNKGIKSVSYNGVKNIFNLKNEIIILSFLAALSVSVYLFNNQDNKQIETIKKTDRIITDTVNNAVLKSDEKTLKISPDSNSNINISDNSKNLINKNKTVKIKVQVPVHKNVVIKKKVFVIDTFDKK